MEDQKLDSTFKEIDAALKDWEHRAARGECLWICADCCVTFPKGMPEACIHDIQECTDIIRSHKKEAQK